MTTVDQVDSLFGRGPFPHFQRSLGLFRPVGTNIGPRVFTSILLGWFPLLLLVFVTSAPGWSALWSFLTDFGTHARSLIAAPLFIFCEPRCLKKLAAIVQHFVRAGVIQKEELPRFEALVASNRSLINTTFAEIVAIVAAYAIAIALARHLPALGMRPWFRTGENTMSLAGWWYSFVSLPLLLILLFGWLWRVVLWGRFLIRIAAMKLHLIAAHPDRASGLKFLNSSLVAFMPLAFTFGVITAGAAANQLHYNNATVETVQTLAIGLIVVVLLVFVGPLLIFVFKLHAKKVEGIYSYGALADDVGRQFEEKWLTNYHEFRSGALEAPDFSATTDLYQVVANVHDMKLFPFELRAVVSLVVAALLPFIPVVLMMMPIKLIVTELARLLV
ncbi:MAG TPA: hypothetical protein VJS13_09980 [Pyrinomonadaceae bacterium]|nr:hypothetical protein [Pyrinomonadaceae bacterium]